MVRGHLTPDGRPVFPIAIGGPTATVVLDTGFVGGLQLPKPWLPIGGPPPSGTAVFQFADGSLATLDVYEVTIEIAGVTLQTELVFNGPSERLIGFEVLKHFFVTLDYPAGEVTLEVP